MRSRFCSMQAELCTPKMTPSWPFFLAARMSSTDSTWRTFGLISKLSRFS